MSETPETDPETETSDTTDTEGTLERSDDADSSALAPAASGISVEHGQLVNGRDADHTEEVETNSVTEPA
ncbi:MAG: hypothetical protein WKF60_06780, partial [Ilumatobacter sp.]